MQKSSVFIAWSEATEEAAEVIKEHLNNDGLHAWTSNDIDGGVQFKEEIREEIKKAELVVAVFPPKPSTWQIAEAGLAYFEKKLVPIWVDNGTGEIQIEEPFNDINTIVVSEKDIAEKNGESLNMISKLVKRKLGISSGRQDYVHYMQLANRLFSTGAAVVAVLLLGSLILFQTSTPSTSSVHLISGHVILGAVVFGGAIFTSLAFCRAGVTTSFSDRQYGLRLGETLFKLWIPIACLQFVYGSWIVYNRVVEIQSNEKLQALGYSYLGNNTWVVVAGAAYLLAILCFVIGRGKYQEARYAATTGEALSIVTKYSFFGNCWFGWGLFFLTSVIMLMNLQRELVS